MLIKLSGQKRVYLLPLVGIFLVGVFMRIYFASAKEQLLSFDETGYFAMAQEVLSGKLVADCCLHGPGYPLFLAPILKVFGQANISAVRYSQIGLDLLTGLAVGAAAAGIFGTTAGFMAAALYFLNPFSASYPGFLLTETLVIFVIAVLGLIISRPGFGAKPVWWFVSGMLVGYLALIKPSFLWFIALFVAVMTAVNGRWVNRLKFVLLSAGAAVLVLTYAVAANYLKFGVISVGPPYYMSVGTLLYLGQYLDRTTEFIPDYIYLSSEPVKVINEYFGLATGNLSGIAGYNDHYTRLFLTKLQENWQPFAASLGRKVFLFWDKRHLFVFNDPYYPRDLWPLRITNIMYFLLASVGFIASVSGFTKKRRPFMIFSLTLFAYMSLAFPAVSTLERHSLPFYPVLIVWAGYGAWRVWQTLRRIMHPGREI